MRIIDGGNAEAASQPFHLRYQWQCLRCRCVFWPDAEDITTEQRQWPYHLRDRAPEPTYSAYHCTCPTCEKDMSVSDRFIEEPGIEFRMTGRFIC